VSDLVWYFAYGSNMHPSTFEGRRGIAPKRAIVARLDGWRLVLDKPPLLPIGESMANVVPDPTAQVWGVAYEITAADLAHVDLTEGVMIGNYRRVDVRVEHGDGVVDASTLSSDRRDATLLPSRRYMTLLIEGAERYGLPAPWVGWLREHPACDESPEAAAARALVDQALQKKEPR
jgi:hypothetical protein